MNEEQDQELQDPEMWDWDAQEELPPESAPASIVGVRLNEEEFEQVAETAERAGLTMSEFAKRSVLRASHVAGDMKYGQENPAKRMQNMMSHLVVSVTTRLSI